MRKYLQQFGIKSIVHKRKNLKRMRPNKIPKTPCSIQIMLLQLGNKAFMASMFFISNTNLKLFQSFSTD